MSEKRYQEVLITTDDLELLKKYQEKYGVSLLSSVPSVSSSFEDDTSKRVIKLPDEITKLREDHEELKRDFKYLESVFERLLDTLNVTLNDMEGKIEDNFSCDLVETEKAYKDYFTNV